MGINLQPCANKIAQENFNKTIADTNPSLTVDLLKPYLRQEEVNFLKEIYHGGQVHVWGVQANNRTKWEEINVGDIVLFTKNKFIFESAVVCYKLHNADLAKALWGTDEHSATWEYTYFVTDLLNINISYETFNELVGYKKDYNHMAFQHLSDEKSGKFLERFPLNSNTFIPNVKINEYYEAIKDPFANASSLDKKMVGTLRKEQSFLRKNLFHNKLVDCCAICGREFPIEFLWASHIKPRYACSMDEKKDYQNIVAPMCKFGCDDLYEKGYIAVTEGKIVVLKRTSARVIDDFLNSLNGKECKYYNERTANYFESHFQTHNFKRTI